MKKVLIPVLSLLVLVAVFVVGNLAINSMKTSIEYRKLTTFILAAYPDAESFEKLENEDFINQGDNFVYEAYKIIVDDTEVGYVYFTSTVGKEKGLLVATGINSLTKTLAGLTVVGYNETPEYIAKVIDYPGFYDQFMNKTINAGLFTIAYPLNSGATLSFTGITKGMQLAREQFAKDTGWKIPAAVTVKSARQNLQNLEQLIYVLTYENKDYNIIFDLNYNVVENTDNAPANLLPTFTTVAKGRPVQALITGVTFNAGKYTLNVKGKGYSSVWIQAELTYDSTSDKIDSFTIVDHEESTGFGADIINSYSNQLLGNHDLPVESSASYTSRGLKAIIALAQQYVDEVIKL
jgi:Na+-translocating ferredoxin:NAD+ oxidoreductase RnfG subunit